VNAVGKANKATSIRRTQEITRLVLAGAEFPEIRQYASDQGWDLSERQIRRYLRRAYQELAQSAHRNRDELLGRHLMQRRALYARALKQQDIKTALSVLKDEASLEGLYHSPSADGKDHSATQPAFQSRMSRAKRTVKFVNATAQNDKQELELLRAATPQYQYLFPDTMLPSLMLQVMALQYVNEQLDYAGMFLLGAWQDSSTDNDGSADFWLITNAYMYRVGHEGWQLFLDQSGLDGDALIKGNYQGQLIKLANENLLKVAPSEEQMQALLQQQSGEQQELVTPEIKAREWRKMFLSACRE
jgi:hypothetical protein